LIYVNQKSVTEKIPEHILEMLNPSGFMKVFLSLCEKDQKYRVTYEETEEIFIENFGRRRYQSYSSFRKAKSRVLKKIK